MMRSTRRRLIALALFTITSACGSETEILDNSAVEPSSVAGITDVSQPSPISSSSNPPATLAILVADSQQTAFSEGRQYLFSGSVLLMKGGVLACQFTFDTSPPTCSGPTLVLPETIRQPLSKRSDLVQIGDDGSGYVSSAFVRVEGPIEFDKDRGQFLVRSAEFAPDQDVRQVEPAFLQGLGSLRLQDTTDDSGSAELLDLAYALSPNGSVMITEDGSSFVVRSLLPLTPASVEVLISSLRGSIRVESWALEA